MLFFRIKRDNTVEVEEEDIVYEDCMKDGH
jgi:hypothetical protein